MEVKAKLISKENFKKFGKVVKLPSTEPTAQAEDYKFWSDISHYEIEGKTEIGICTVYKQEKNIVEGVERHLRTPEILIPIDAPFIVPLLLENDSEEKMEAFVVGLGEAVVINNGVWHGACIPVGKEKSSYFVIFRLGTPSEDVEKKDVKKVEIIE